MSWKIVATTALWVTALLIPTATAINVEVKRAGPACTDGKVKSFVSTLIADRAIDPDSLCSSYLHYTQTYKTVYTPYTDTRTATSTQNKGTTTSTSTIIKTQKNNGSGSSATGGANQNENQDENENSNGNANRKRADTITPAAAAATKSETSKIYGFGSETVSAGCSCLVTKPTGTSTFTYNSGLVVVTSTYTTTLSIKTVVVKTTVTVPGTSVSVPASATSKCASADPTFWVQFRAKGSRKDIFTNSFLAIAPDTYRGLGQGYVVTTTSSLQNAALLTLELKTGRLKLAKENLYANAEYFVSLTPVYFDPAAWIIRNEWQFLETTLSNGILNVYVRYPAERTIMETCPEYVKYYYTAVALGDVEDVDGPVCYAKQMVVIPACTPK